MKKKFSELGDKGFTALAGGKKTKKTSALIEMQGSVDELNSFLGFAVEALLSGKQDFEQLIKAIYRIQGELFEVGMQLTSNNKFILNSLKIKQLEMEIDQMSDKLPVLDSFVLPGGGESGSRLHLARAVCRRAERDAFKLFELDNNTQLVAIYLNRLSDWLYVAARSAANIASIEEQVWSAKR